MFLVATLLNLIRNAWKLALRVTWPTTGNFFNDDILGRRVARNYQTVPEYVNVVDPILDGWIAFVALVFIFAIGFQNDTAVYIR